MRISIGIPVYDFPNSDFFLNRALESIKIQIFKDYEIVITKDGKMAENTNSAIKKSKGELIKILYMDDWLADENALQDIVDSFEGQWLITGCSDNPHPFYSANRNTLGSPSCLTIKNENPLMFNDNYSWILDLDYYKRMFAKYGEPKILDKIGVKMGIGLHQHTYKLSDEEKLKEEQSYAKSFIR